MADNQITPFQLTDQFTMDNFNQRINETNTALQKKADLGEDGKVPAGQVDAYSKSESISAETRTALSLAETATPDAALAEIARQLSESGITRMDLLWENASPTSDFAAQTISIDLSAYELVAVEAKEAGVIFIRVEGIAINVGTHFGFQLGRSRVFEATTGGVVCWEGKQGYWNSGSEWKISNGEVIPYRIYGLKI